MKISRESWLVDCAGMGSMTDVEYCTLPPAHRWWPNVAEVLLIPRATSEAYAMGVMDAVAEAVHGHSPDQDRVGLQTAIEEMTAADPSFDFVGAVFPCVRRLALSAPSLFAACGHRVPLLKQGIPSTVSLSRRQIASLLACAFFDFLQPAVRTDPAAPPVGELSFHNIFSSHARVGIERIKCLLAYFMLCAADTDADGAFLAGAGGDVVEFVRAHDPQPLSAAAWRAHTADLSSLDLTVAAVAMEDFADATVFVDFANRDLMLGEVIPSATQEEILFSVRPELFAAVVFCERMAPSEAVLIRGARTYCAYSGYGGTFRFAGVAPLWRTAAPTAVLAIDAHPTVAGEQFESALIARDLCKAHVGFAACGPGSVIATGQWGCGAFGGLFLLKFLQQAMAAAAVGDRALRVSTFADAAAAQRMAALWQRIVKAHVTVGRLFEIIAAERPAFFARRGAFEQHFDAAIAALCGDADVAALPTDLLSDVSEAEQRAVALRQQAAQAEAEGRFAEAVALYRAAERLLANAS